MASSHESTASFRVGTLLLSAACYGDAHATEARSCERGVANTSPVCVLTYPIA